MNSTTTSPQTAGDAQDPHDPEPAATPAEARLLAAIKEYTAAQEAGQTPNRQELLARYPDVAAELSMCLQGLTFVKSAAAQMAGDSAQANPNLDVAHAQPLGDFQLLREIGRGGMGVIYEAMQLSLGRRVAVKVLPLAAALDANHLQRFKNEAQAAAQLHHTNIVPVYAVGCERSVHFYAMQLIDGVSVADLIDELRAADGRSIDSIPESVGAKTTRTFLGSNPYSEAQSVSEKPAPNPASSEILTTLVGKKRSSYFQMVARLGLQAAEALDYAHQLGVVHRDIKPANLLVDRRGNLWITDFGLAQFYGDQNLTRTGDLLGTLRYMSPEQASGRATVLDQRTDVYSLGMTLYELLTLERALPGKSREELLHQIGSLDPRPPRSLDKTIPIELQTILAKAAAKDPIERYPSAKALGDDLRRFLTDEPILARPPTLWNKAVKWTRRHRALALSAIIMLFIAAIGLLISTLLIARAQTKTAAAYAMEQHQREMAEKSFEEARQAVKTLTDVAADELPHDPQSQAARIHLLQVALLYYQTFIDEHKEDASISAELNAAHDRVYAILSDLSAIDELNRLSSMINLLDQPPVQSDLGLASDKALEIHQLKNDFPFTPPGSPDNAAKLDARKSQAQAALNSLLTPAQLDRLHQIAVQTAGLNAFDDPDVQTALALTADQKDAIQKIRAEISFRPGGPGDRGGPGGFGGPGGPPGPGPGFRGGGPFGPPQNEAGMKKVLALLTPDQTASWQTLIGKPFNRNANRPPRRDFEMRLPTQ